MSIEQQNGFKDSTSLAKWTKWSLYALIVITAIAITSNMLEYQLLSDFYRGVYTSQKLTIAAGEANDAR